MSVTKTVKYGHCYPTTTKKLLHSMQPKCSLPRSQQLATCCCPKPDKSSSHPPIYTQVFHIVSYLQISPHKPVYISSLPNTCHISCPSPVLHLITQTFCDQHKSRSCSLCSTVHAAVNIMTTTM